jgi:hypothetical protein
VFRGLDVEASRALQAAVLAFKAADKSIQRTVRQDTVREFRPVWVDGVRRKAAQGKGGRQRAALLRAGVSFAGSNPPTATAYTSKRRLSGGLGTDRWQAYEFGALDGTRKAKDTYTRRSPKGTPHDVTRATRAQLPPYFQKDGYAVFVVARKIAPRVASFWTQSIMRAYIEAVD